MNDGAYYDVIVVGGGPAGSTCAATCAEAGLSALLLERESFPRDKVCGDCLNPSCQPIFDRLGVGEKIRQLVHSPVRTVDFIPTSGPSLTVSIRHANEVSVKRALLDDALLQQAISKGARVMQRTTVTEVTPEWKVLTTSGEYRSKFLVGADGRNSLVARLAGLRKPAAVRDRVAVQTHLPLPPELEGRLALRLFPMGYAGFADVGGGQLNLCLVGAPGNVGKLKAEAASRFEIPDGCEWRSVTPISRPPSRIAKDGLLLVGDAAKVVEPFTGEGIYYALRSGELAAQGIIESLRGKSCDAASSYTKMHAQLYRNRLWVNRLAREAVLRPWLGDGLIGLGRLQPWLFRYLTAKIVGSA